MTITREDVEHVALLARLALSEEEIEHYTEQLASIVEHMAILNRLDLDGVPATASVVAASNVWAVDEARPSLPLAEVLRNAPDSDGRFIRVRAVLDHDSGATTHDQ